MATTICPLFEEAFYSYSIDLSNETFTLSFRWSDRSNQWLMSIENAEGEMVVRGVALVPIYPLTEHLSLEQPKGDFILVPVDVTAPAVPNPREIYKTHYLVYDTEL